MYLSRKYIIRGLVIEENKDVSCTATFQKVSDIVAWLGEFREQT
jgi:hypothetical protein